MKTVPVHITPHNIGLSPRSRNFIEKKVSALLRFARDIIQADVVLRGKGGAAQLFSVSARVALPGSDLQANATHASLYGAVHQLADRLARLARKRKTRFVGAFRRPGKKHTRFEYMRPDAVRIDTQMLSERSHLSLSQLTRKPPT